MSVQAVVAPNCTFDEGRATTVVENAIQELLVQKLPLTLFTILDKHTPEITCKGRVVTATYFDSAPPKLGVTVRFDHITKMIQTTTPFGTLRGTFTQFPTKLRNLSEWQALSFTKTHHNSKLKIGTNDAIKFVLNNLSILIELESNTASKVVFPELNICISTQTDTSLSEESLRLLHQTSDTYIRIKI